MGFRLFDRMRHNPNDGWTIRDIEILCRHYKISCDPPRGGGSHYKVHVARHGFRLTVPAKRPIKPIYIKALVGLVAIIEDERN